jgi:hypothetical protein
METFGDLRGRVNREIRGAGEKLKISQVCNLGRGLYVGLSSEARLCNDQNITLTHILNIGLKLWPVSVGASKPLVSKDLLTSSGLKCAIWISTFWSLLLQRAYQTFILVPNQL